MNFKRETLWVLVIVIAAVLPFLNSLSGEFVYDDRRQIVANPLIQENELVRKALTSDVWAFKGDGTVPVSNYWRPTFTAWCILNFRLFGLEPFGWHVLNILLHLGVCLVAYAQLRRWGLPPVFATGITAVFAVHPVHTESVAWISGSPDILFAFFFLLSLLFADRSRDGNRVRNIVASVISYLLALGSKEVAVVCFPILLLVFSKRDETSSWRSQLLDSKAWRSVSLYAGAAAAFFIARLAILGEVSRPAENSSSTTSALLTIASAFVFYLKQIVFPFWIGPNYPLRPVDDVGVSNFVLPLAITVGVVIAIMYAGKDSFRRRIGAALFLLPLAPAFLISAFPAEQIVHDRYLYLPLLGFLIVVIDGAISLGKKYFEESAADYIFAACMVVTLLMAFRTFTYNKAWQTELSLWSYAVSVDDKSASNWLQLAAELAERNQIAAADTAYQRALAIREDPVALMGASRIAIVKGDLDRAVRDLEKVLATPSESISADTLFRSYESIAVAHQQRKDFPAAERRLREGRDRLPIYRAALTEQLAVVLYNQNRKQEALAELESVRGQARREMLPASKSVFLRLGMLYAEQGRNDDARAALQQFLAETDRVRNQATSDDRRTAEDLLRKVK